MYITQEILRKAPINELYKAYYMLITEFEGLECKDDIIQMCNLYDNQYDKDVDVDVDRFINTLLEHEYSDDNVVDDLLEIVTRQVI